MSDCHPSLSLSLRPSSPLSLSSTFSLSPSEVVEMNSIWKMERGVREDRQGGRTGREGGGGEKGESFVWRGDLEQTVISLFYKL